MNISFMLPHFNLNSIYSEMEWKYNLRSFVRVHINLRGHKDVKYLVDVFKAFIENSLILSSST